MTLTRRDLLEVADELAAFCDPDAIAGFRPRYNVAPTDAHVILQAPGGGRVLTRAVWGMFVRGRERPPVINARAETAGVKPGFREAFTARRCVVPADGFLEWMDAPDGRQPIWFHRPDGKLLLMAGLFDEERDDVGAPLRRFAVLTTPPNAVVQPVHDRMPALLGDGDAETWLRAPSQELLRPAPDDWLVATPVSRRVNSPKHDDPDCLTPVAASLQRRQLSLF